MNDVLSHHMLVLSHSAGDKVIVHSAYWYR